MQTKIELYFITQIVEFLLSLRCFSKITALVFMLLLTYCCSQTKLCAVFFKASPIRHLTVTNRSFTRRPHAKETLKLCAQFYRGQFWVYPT